MTPQCTLTFSLVDSDYNPIPTTWPITFNTSKTHVLMGPSTDPKQATIYNINVKAEILYGS